MDERILKYFQNELTIAERLEFLREAERDETLKRQFVEYQNIRALAHLSSYGEDREEGKKKYKQFAGRIRRINGYRWTVRIMKYAAVFAIVILSVYWLAERQVTDTFRKKLMAETNVLYAPVGQRARVTLQDGSVVWLNAQSTLTYPSSFLGSERRVTLKGEGYFEVAPDSEKPFIVSASQGVEMKVLGTKFNVYSYPETGIVRTCLLEGSVQVSCEGISSKGVILEPNQQVTVRNGKMIVGKIKHPAALLWKDGIYSFDNETLENIVRQLELYYNVEIHITNPALAKVRYTCKFRQRDGIEEIIHIIQKIHHFKIKIDKDKNTITLS